MFVGSFNAVSATSSDSGSVAFDDAVEKAYSSSSRVFLKNAAGERCDTSFSIAE